MNDDGFRWRGRVKAWLDGELSAAESAHVARLVETDPELRQLAEDFRALSRRIRADEDRPLPRIDVGAVWARGRSLRSDTESVLRFLRRVSAAAAAVLVLATGVAFATNDAGATGDPGSGGSGSYATGPVFSEAGGVTDPEASSLESFLREQEELTALSVRRSY